MALPIYLAMTPWEFRYSQLPSHCGWMGCHFSSYGSGLTGIPETLPENALLILNDKIPPQGHDPALILRQLKQAAQSLSPCGILLDLQRPGCDAIPELLRLLHDALPCPVGVSALYANDWDGPVLLPPVPPDVPIAAYLQPWSGKTIWLEIDRGDLVLTLTKDGCQCHTEALSPEDTWHYDKDLYCHYRIQTEADRAVFSLGRTWEDINALLCHGERLGISMAVGLYQELFYLSTAGHRLL